MKQTFFTANHKNADIRKKSSSGGVFTAVSDKWFEIHGEKAVIYGCTLDENLNAVHIRATQPEYRNLMRGSKYIQSDISGVYNEIANDISNNWFVLFSGTPCQVSGLKAFLKAKNIDFSNFLFTVDFVCHGVGSNRFFEDNIKNLEKKYKSRAVFCSFRAKSRPDKLQEMEVRFENGKKYNSQSAKYDWFFSVYNSKNYILRPSCYNCKFAKPERMADITLSDNWAGYANKSPYLSAIIASSEKGKDLIENCSFCLDFNEVSQQDVYQEHLYHPTKLSENRNKFIEIYKKDGYLAAQRYVGNNTVKGKFRYLAAKIINKLHLRKIFKMLKSVSKR